MDLAPPPRHPQPPSRWGIALLLLLALLMPAARAATIVRHALAQQQSAAEITYELAVLQLLLDKTLGSHGPYRLQPVDAMTQNRAFLQLAAGEVDVISSMTSRERERQGLPLRVCLYRGLLGVRLPLALAARRAELEAAGSGNLVAEPPRALRIGQVADWPDAAVLQHNGWRVERMARLQPFAELLRRQRIDLVALGALEVYPIADARADLAVLERWAIAYPSAFYFFVSPAQPALAERLRQGWERALADGSFEALFEKRLGPQLARARLAQRHWWPLGNPELPPDTPLADARLWHPLVRSRLLNPSPSTRGAPP